MDDMTTFIRARIDELASRAVPGVVAAFRAIVDGLDYVAADYRVTHAEFTAGRRLGLGEAAAHLATIWDDHPDYREDWRP